MIKTTDRPSAESLWLGVILAPLVPSILLGVGFALLGGGTWAATIASAVVGTTIAAAFAFAFAILLGAPTLLLLRSRLPYRAWVIVPIATLIGGLPSIPLGLWPFGFVGGFLGGVVFWIIASADIRRQRRHFSIPGKEPGKAEPGLGEPTNDAPSRTSWQGAAIFGSIMLVLALPVACQIMLVFPVPQPSSSRTVRVVEVPLADARDVMDFKALLQRHARQQGMEFYSGATSTPGSSNRGSEISVALWRRDGRRREPEIIITPSPDQSPPWIFFSEGLNALQASRARADLIVQLERRFPGVLDVPVLPTGGAPLRHDLALTPQGYVIKPEAVARYADDARSHRR